MKRPEIDKEELQKRVINEHPSYVVGEDEVEAACRADAEAMELVHDRHSKRDLVNLVRYLIVHSEPGTLPYK